MAHKKGQGAAKNGRDSTSKRRGVKKFGAKTETYAFRGELTEEERRRLWEMCR